MAARRTSALTPPPLLRGYTDLTSVIGLPKLVSMLKESIDLQ
jgi:hypothetical protein